MIATMKCSNCGAAMSNLNMAWSWKNAVVMIAIMLLGSLPILKMTLFKADVTKELTISDIQTRTTDGQLEIVGLITNTGNRTWSLVTVEAEFFDASGGFIDEASEFVQANIAGRAKEHFKIVIRSPSTLLTKPGTKTNVKIAGGHTPPF